MLMQMQINQVLCSDLLNYLLVIKHVIIMVYLTCSLDQITWVVSQSVVSFNLL
jgi:hypothetical protein